jgi:hypothetical protein
MSLRVMFTAFYNGSGPRVQGFGRFCNLWPWYHLILPPVCWSWLPLGNSLAHVDSIGNPAFNVVCGWSTKNSRELPEFKHSHRLAFSSTFTRCFLNHLSHAVLPLVFAFLCSLLLCVSGYQIFPRASTKTSHICTTLDFPQMWSPIVR